MSAKDISNTNIIIIKKGQLPCPRRNNILLRNQANKHPPLCLVQKGYEKRTMGIMATTK